MTQDRLPHAGQRDGLYYTTGYSGPRHADVGADGRAHGRGDGRQCRRQPLAPPGLARHSGHLGPPWFLPAVGLYYQLKDKLA